MKTVGLSEPPDEVVRESVALFLFQKGLISIGKAAELANMGLARFMELATILALLSSSITASAEVSDARIMASDSPRPKNLERADAARVLLTCFLTMQPDFMPLETSIAPGRPAPFRTTSSNTASGMVNLWYSAGR